MTRFQTMIYAIIGLSFAFQTIESARGNPIPNERQADGWVTHPLATEMDRPVVLHFRRLIKLDHSPARFPVSVTADNRFVLYVNGIRVGAGPSTGDIAHWRQSSKDLAPYLRRGTNVISAVVWSAVKTPMQIPHNASREERDAIARANFLGQIAPYFQQSISTGFRLQGSGVAKAFSTGELGWRVKVDAGRTMANGMVQRMPGWYIAGAPETIDASKATWDAENSEVAETGWVDAVSAPAAVRELKPDKLPAQTYVEVQPDRIVKADPEGTQGFPKHAVTIPAGRHVKLLMQRDAMVSAYPQLQVTGGKGATIKVTYAEALYDRNGHKGDRSLVADRVPKGVFDTFLPDGNTRSFGPLWWRTWRYAEIDIATAAEPLRLDRWRVFQTGYPFAQVGQFKSSDPDLDRIWSIGWRTAQIDAHETYMDSAYWEQLQYVGDTRLQMLISYDVSGDPRLAEQALDAFADSNVDGGLTEGAYPSRTSNVIATFSLLWIGMLEDWRMNQPDTDPITRNIPRMRQVLGWFEPWLSPRGLLTRNPQWNFVDWVGQTAGDRSVFPSYSRETGESCLLSVHYVGALRQGASIENALGDPTNGRRYAGMADRISGAIRDNCWNSDQKMFSDNPDKQVFSQQMNALAIIYDVAPPAEVSTLLDRIVAPGKGIDAPKGMFSSSYYFAWYLTRAFEHAGHGDRYFDLLKTWRELLALNYTTWPEERGTTRSDTHAWSAHPTSDLLRVVAGIQPGAPGYSRVLIKPNLGNLTWLDAVAATPNGPIHAQYKKKGSNLHVKIYNPSGLPGVIEWKNHIDTIKVGINRFKFSIN